MAKQPRILTGQVAAITGGARGIGRALAEALVRQGMRVAIGDLDLELARTTAAEIGAGTTAFGLDVTDRPSVERFVADVEGALGPIDVFVNNAGIMPLSHFLDEDDATAHRIIDINVHGVLYGMKAVLPGMVERGRGHVVNLASQAGKFGFAGGATYCASKFAVVGVTESVRAELRLMGATDVWLSVVMPAIVSTELGGGLSKPLGQKDIEPTDVADATVEALQTGRFDVWVPRENVGVYALSSLLPRRPREAIGRAMRADRTLWSIDAGQRQAYELRAARPVASLEPGDDGPAQLGAGTDG
ncbi:MAG: family oxidoreductase [Solirubrobacterales bacterium]|jgi:NADP-dependent 3-hydroxy acid dehydrogenase YdfG|nr:family oxidoreductase [Solirubrobacterales bacterium]